MYARNTKILTFALLRAANYPNGNYSGIHQQGNIWSMFYSYNEMLHKNK